VLVLAYPVLPGEDTPVLTDCDKDCLALLAQAQEPLSAARVRRILEKRGIGIHAEITALREQLAECRRLLEERVTRLREELGERYRSRN
jgi:hypothetical protein